MAKIIVPAVTILDENEKPDHEGNEKLINYLIEGGVDGILVLGSAGEFPYFSVGERLDYYRFCSDCVGGRAELLAGTGCMGYQDTLMLSNAVCKWGYRPMVIGPYYFGIGQDKLFDYYDRLADEIDGDFYLYNYPARTGHSIAPETVGALAAKHPNVIGIKDSVSEPGHTNLVFRAVEGRPFLVYSGFDDQFLENLANGGAGCIGALSNVAPEIWSALIRAANQGDYRRLFRLFHLIQKLMPLYGMDTNCSRLLKKLLVHRGVAVDPRAVFPFDRTETDAGKAEALLDSVLEEYREYCRCGNQASTE